MQTLQVIFIFAFHTIFLDTYNGQEKERERQQAERTEERNAGRGKTQERSG